MQRTRRRAVLAICSALAALAAAETVLRLLRYGDHVPVLPVDENAAAAISSGLMRADRQLLWRISRCDRYGESVRLAHPDNPAIRPPAPGVRRVVCLGDSCTFFPGRSGEPYSVLLERRLGSPSAPVEVLNAGVPGYSGAQGLAWLRSGLPAYRPELVTVYFGWNDHWRALALTDRESMKALAASPLRLMRLFRDIRGRLRRQPRAGDRPRRVPPEDYADALRQIHRLVAGVRGRCLLLTAPGLGVQRTRSELLGCRHLEEGDDYMALHGQYNDIVRSLRKEGIAVLDLDALFRKHEQPALLFADDGIHLSDAGHELIAQTLRDEIVTHNLLGR
jgi:lysophospholipase L1-like esterase